VQVEKHMTHSSAAAVFCGLLEEIVSIFCGILNDNYAPEADINLISF